MYKRKLIYRIIFAIIGITILAMGLSFMRYAVLGVDPITCLNIGIAKQVGLSFGTWQLIMCFILLIGVFIFDRGKIGFGTIYILVASGYTSDFFLWLITKIPLLETFSLVIRVIVFTLGLITVYFGSAVYIETNMGLSPYDAIAIIISEKIKRQNWFRWIRIGTDALCVIGGILTKSDVGIGTLVSVLIGGPLIAFYRKLLKYRIGKKQAK
ncbi:YczE/YyaS/YitT family protein [Treponema sp. R80B11-R83G3]